MKVKRKRVKDHHKEIQASIQPSKADTTGGWKEHLAEADLRPPAAPVIEDATDDRAARQDQHGSSSIHRTEE